MADIILLSNHIFLLASTYFPYLASHIFKDGRPVPFLFSITVRFSMFSIFWKNVLCRAATCHVSAPSSPMVVNEAIFFMVLRHLFPFWHVLYVVYCYICQFSFDLSYSCFWVFLFIVCPVQFLVGYLSLYCIPCVPLGPTCPITIGVNFFSHEWWV